MKVVTLKILCLDDEAEEIEGAILSSEISKLGLCCLTVTCAEPTDADRQLAKQVMGQRPFAIASAIE